MKPVIVNLAFYKYYYEYLVCYLEQLKSLVIQTIFSFSALTHKVWERRQSMGIGHINHNSRVIIATSVSFFVTLYIHYCSAVVIMLKAGCKDFLKNSYL